MADTQLPILNVHTPTSSFAIVYSSKSHHSDSLDETLNHSVDTDDTLESLYDKLGRKLSGEQVQPGWVKYSWNDSIWNLDDGRYSGYFSHDYYVLNDLGRSPYLESDYTIFVWRQKSVVQGRDSLPVLHVRDPDQPLPQPPAYQNASYYRFWPKQEASSPPSSRSNGDKQSIKSGKSKKTIKANPQDSVPKHKKEFDKFHSENGVRTISGNIGPVQNGAESLNRVYQID